MSHPDQFYYWTRAVEELERGEQSVDATVAAVHYELSYRYGLLAARLVAGKPALTVIDGGRDRLAA